MALGSKILSKLPHLTKHKQKAHEHAAQDVHDARDQADDAVVEKIAREKEDVHQLHQREAAHDEAFQDDPLNTNYGQLSLVGAVTGELVTIEHISTLTPGASVLFRARVQHLRSQGPKLAFFVFRQQLFTIQGVLQTREGVVSPNMVRWAEHLPLETIVLVSGRIQTPVGQDEIHNASIHHLEVLIDQMHIVGKVTEHVPFDIENAARPESDFQNEEYAARRVTARAHFNARVASLRTPTSQAIFRIRAAVCSAYRSYLDSQGFIEIQSSKFQQGATESGASVFRVDYFHRTATLAQSPQLAKQMAIAADLNRVYEIGPVFRAENSQTARHLTEFTGLDLEMAITNSYEEVIDTLDNALKAIFKHLQANFRKEIDTVRHQFPSDDLVFLEETPRIKFKDGIQMLREAGYVEEDGNPPDELEDLTTPAEKRLGALVKEKYGTDFYILDKFPAVVRPFYTMPDPDDPRYSNSADFFLRGQEILSGGQRIHDATLLEQKLQAAKIEISDMQDYVNGFRWGCPPHGGGGIGLERVVMLFLNLSSVRWATMLPRDPRSFPNSTQDPRDAGGHSLRGPESSTVEFAAISKLEKRGSTNPTSPVPTSPSSITSPIPNGHGLATHGTTSTVTSAFPADVTPHSLLNGLKSSNTSAATSATSSSFSTNDTATTTGTATPSKRHSLLPHRKDSKDSKEVAASSANTPKAPKSGALIAKIDTSRLPPLENLVATYGDSSNTAWLDPQWTVWRDEPTGAAIGYRESEGYALVWGRPLCDDSQLHQVIERYLHFLSDQAKLKAMWACVDEPTEHVLARDFGWASLIVAAEERIDPTMYNPEHNRNLARKIRSAKSKGVTAVDAGDGTIPDEVKADIEKGIEAWRKGRTGKQVHSTEIQPWDDESHRRYFYAKTSGGHVVALVVLAQLSRERGFQIKFSLEFPDAPAGSIELLLDHALNTMAAAGLRTATFGTSATPNLTPGENFKGWKVKVMERAYGTITKTLGLLSKPEFRAKFGTELDPVYFCYPRKSGFGVGGIHALMAALTD